MNKTHAAKRILRRANLSDPQLSNRERIELYTTAATMFPEGSPEQTAADQHAFALKEAEHHQTRFNHLLDEES